MKSRLRSHQNESAPTLFHGNLGIVDPNTVRLEMSFQPDETSSYDVHMELLSALLHERHHWLQHVGTSAGMYGSILLESQGNLIASVVNSGDLRLEDLPLIKREDKFGEPLMAWERIEATRRIFFGCRPSDFKVLTDDDRNPLWRGLVPLTEPLFAAAFEDLPELDTLLGHLADAGERASADGSFLFQHGWLIGARHLMEGAARLSEVMRAAHGRLAIHAVSADCPAPAEFNATPYFAGIYGVAQKLFYEIVGQPVSPASEVGFSFACDFALNCLTPPVHPFPMHLPGTVFVYVCNELATFRFDRTIDVFDAADVRSLLAELKMHVSEELNQAADYRVAMIDRFFGPLDVDQVVAQISRFLKDDSPDEPLPRGIRYRYGVALSVRAQKLRAEVPELFVYPSAIYIEDRKRFRQLFDQVAPPLVSFGSSGIAPTRAVDGWLEFFLSAAVQYEVNRGMVMLDASALSARLAPYVRSVGGEEHGRSVVRSALLDMFDGAPIGEEIWRRTELAVDAISNARTGSSLPPAG